MFLPKLQLPLLLKRQALRLLAPRRRTAAPIALLCVCALGGSSLPIQLSAEEILITNLEDVDFGVVPPTTGTLEGNSDLCVVGPPRGFYSLLGFGNGSNGAFSLIETGNAIHTLDYSVSISDRGSNRGQPLIAGVPLTNLRPGNIRGNGRCAPGGNIRVIIDGGDIQGTRPGHYNGTLTLTVVPE